MPGATVATVSFSSLLNCHYYHNRTNHLKLKWRVEKINQAYLSFFGNEKPESNFVFVGQFVVLIPSNDCFRSNDTVFELTVRTKLGSQQKINLGRSPFYQCSDLFDDSKLCLLRNMQHFVWIAK